MKIALAQIDISWENKVKNMETCENIIKHAVDMDAEMIVFPEMTLTGFSMNVNETAECKDDSITLKFFRKLSLEHAIVVVFGYTLKDKGNITNRLCIVKKGKIVLEYDKIHPFSYAGENRFFNSGDCICSADINGIRVGASICYDLRFPDIYQLTSKDSDIILVIANWPSSRQQQWETLLKARAIENQCYIVGVNRVGTGDDLIYNGGSCIVDPYGNIIAEGKEQEGLIIGDVNGEVVSQYRKSFPVRVDRKENLYQRLREIRNIQVF